MWTCTLHIFLAESAPLCMYVPECVRARVYKTHFSVHKPWQVSSSTWTELSERRVRLVLSYQLNPLWDDEWNTLREFYVLLWSCLFMELSSGKHPQRFSQSPRQQVLWYAGLGSLIEHQDKSYVNCLHRIMQLPWHWIMYTILELVE